MTQAPTSHCDRADIHALFQPKNMSTAHTTHTYHDGQNTVHSLHIAKDVEKVSNNASLKYVVCQTGNITI